MKNRTIRSMFIGVVGIMMFLTLFTPLQVSAAEVNEQEEVQETESEELVPEVPLYFQADYASTNYGAYGTVASHGCGITSVAMVLSYLMDEPIMPDFLAKEYGRYNTEHGSSHALFGDSGADYGLTVIQTYDWQEVMEALENGHVVIANPHECLFTGGGHFIVLYGMNKDGKILVHDPNKYNYFFANEWCDSRLTEGFLYGFDESYFNPECLPCWIYPLKDMEAVEARRLEKEYEEDLALFEELFSLS